MHVPDVEATTASLVVELGDDVARTGCWAPRASRSRSHDAPLPEAVGSPSSHRRSVSCPDLRSDHRAGGRRRAAGWEVGGSSGTTSSATGSAGLAVPDPWVLLTAVAGSHGAHPARHRYHADPTASPVPARPDAGVGRSSRMERVVLGAGLGIGPYSSIACSRRRRMASEGARPPTRRLTAWRGGWPARRSTACCSHPRPCSVRGVTVWIGGESAAALRRASSRWDGWCVGAVDERVRSVSADPEHIAGVRERIGAPIDIAITGVSEPGEPNLVREYADAGATWWLETLAWFSLPTTRRSWRESSRRAADDAVAFRRAPLHHALDARTQRCRHPQRAPERLKEVNAEVEALGVKVHRPVRAARPVRLPQHHRGAGRRDDDAAGDHARRPGAR